MSILSQPATQHWTPRHIFEMGSKVNTMNASAETAIWIENTVNKYMTTSSENTLNNRSDDKAFELPLVGFSKGDDPLYEAYKDYVGPFHLTPWEIFAVTFRGIPIEPEELAVVSWILLHNKTTKRNYMAK